MDFKIVIFSASDVGLASFTTLITMEALLSDLTRKRHYVTINSLLHYITKQAATNFAIVSKLEIGNATARLHSTVQFCLKPKPVN